MTRTLDLCAAIFGLLLLFPLLLILCLLVWVQDWHSPFYIPSRIGRAGRPYKMVKLRSMVMRADSNKVDSTANNDPRITAVGRFIRRFKLDELPQLWNVLKGEMSLVGPRPNVSRETDLYTHEEKRLLSVRPGITDIASIVFADEGSILEGKSDPDLTYNQIIRPWKSRLALLYVDRPSASVYLKVIILTLLSAADRKAALEKVGLLASQCGASIELAQIATRKGPLHAAPPPGADLIVTSRGI